MMLPKDCVNRFHPGFPNIPYSRVIGQWHVKNILLPVYARSRSRYTVRHAVRDDIDTIAELIEAGNTGRGFLDPS